ncbi:MAG TPA: serine/threonine-protein kinase, partial [Kofleriaceae bacterium]|nr:serine/threonine-protein kinase [Kofleriaceae bacterium]
MDDEDDLSTPPAFADTIEGLLARVVATPSVQPLLAPGTQIAARYQLERVLGAGGMGTVYLAHDRQLDRRVAIKLHRGTELATHLHDEAVAMARLAHPNVVTVYEVGELDGHPFVAMEYVAGTTLRAWLPKKTRREILAVLRAAGEGLVAAHAAGLVHRDVKPDNVLVGNDGRTRIGDFGLAQRDQAGTQSGGTPAYMAPEQKRGDDVDARSDQYAFAVMAEEALGARCPARIRRVLARARSEQREARY